MSADRRIVSVTPGSELAQLIDESERVAIVLERNGRRFRLIQDDVDETAVVDDSDRILKAFEHASGVFAGMVVDRLTSDLRKQRIQDDSEPSV